jgi:hypothetical protein
MSFMIQVPGDFRALHCFREFQLTVLMGLLKSLPGTNTLAYYKICKLRFLITLGPEAYAIKLFTTIIYGFS